MKQTAAVFGLANIALRVAAVVTGRDIQAKSTLALLARNRV
jgi:hypothetical protein